MQLEVGKFYEATHKQCGGKYMIEIIADLDTPCASTGRYVGKVNNGSGFFFIATFSAGGDFVSGPDFLGSIVREAESGTYLVLVDGKMIEKTGLLATIKDHYLDVYKKV